MQRPADPFHERIGHVADEILDAIEDTLAGLKRASAPPPEPARLPLTVERRALANRLRVSTVCPLNKCRRAHCCRGEPAHCLRIMLALMPAETVERFNRVHENLLLG